MPPGDRQLLLSSFAEGLLDLRNRSAWQRDQQVRNFTAGLKDSTANPVRAK